MRLSTSWHTSKIVIVAAVIPLLAGCGGGDSSSAVHDATASQGDGGGSGGDPDAATEADSGPDESGCTSDQACQLVLGAAPVCQAVACVDGTCQVIADGGADGEACQPVDLCMAEGVCAAGACESDGPRDCDDGNPCTNDSCESTIGCLLEPAVDGVSCDDGDACTVGDTCVGGTCVTEPMDCDDDDPCTIGDGCVDGACIAGTVEPCDDGNGCTIDDACDSATGDCVGTTTDACDCVADADCEEVEDGDVCNGTLVCLGGTCEVDGASVLTCPPASEPCAVATCDPDTGACGFGDAEAGTLCDDGDGCTANDVCDDGGGCLAGAPVDCGDENECTVDACEAGVCQHTFDSQCGCEGLECPPDGEYGDALKLRHSNTSPVESVGTQIIDGHVFTCGGFGMDIFRINQEPVWGFAHMSSGLPRCQNIEAGRVIGDQRIVYVSNHGDAYVKTPSIFTLLFHPGSGTFQQLDSITLTGFSPEGMAWDAEFGVLWVAMHESGVRRYSVSDDGRLTYLDEHGGFDNAYRLVVAGGYVYVADGEGGLKIAERATGEVIGGMDAVGFAKDIEVTGTMALVAASSMGIHAFDVSDPTDPQTLDVVFTWGTALCTDLLMGGTRLAVSTHDEVAVLDVSHPDALKILASDRGTSKSVSARNLCVAAADDLVIAAEWLGIGLLTWEEGLIAPEIHIDRGSLTIPGVEVGEQLTEVIGVTNRGWLPLTISDIDTSNDKEWSVSPTSLDLLPGETAPLAVTFSPGSAQPAANSLVFSSDDPDENPMSFPIIGNPNTGKLDAGEPLTADFDFLDTESPEGEKSLENLQGTILVLAYFATF